MKYITIKEASEKWGITERSVRRYCVEGQVVGAIMVNKHFKIPADAEKPSKNQERFSVFIRFFNAILSFFTKLFNGELDLSFGKGE